MDYVTKEEIREVLFYLREHNKTEYEKVLLKMTGLLVLKDLIR